MSQSGAPLPMPPEGRSWIGTPSGRRADPYDVARAGALDWSARSELAKKWAVEAGAPLADLVVTDACTRRLVA